MMPVFRIAKLTLLLSLLLFLLINCGRAEFGAVRDPDNNRSRDANPGGPGGGPDPDPLKPGDEVTFDAGIFSADMIERTGRRQQVQETITQRADPDRTLLEQFVGPGLETEAFTQGGLGPMTTDRFPVEAGALDLLVVIDNSSSMFGDQRRFISIDNLVYPLRTTDWRVAVVTTDDSCHRDLITAEEYRTNPTRVRTRFHRAIAAGLTGSDIERGFKMAVLGLQGYCRGVVNSWLREDASHAVVVISDEDNCGYDEGGCPGAEDESVDYFLTHAPGVTFNAIINHPEDDFHVGGLFCCSPQEGVRYADAVTRTGGSWAPICRREGHRALREVTTHLARTVQVSYTLSQTPDNSRFEVTVDGNPVVSGFTRTGNRIFFDVEVLTGHSEIVVRYSTGSTPRQTSFALAGVPPDGISEVRVNDLATSDYVYDINRNEVIFPAPPPDHAVIEVDYPTAGQSEFMLEPGLDENFLVVRVGGARTEDFHYDVTTGSIHLHSLDPSGTEVQILYASPSSRVTRYGFTPAVGNVTEITVIDLSTGNHLAHTIDGSEIVFPEDQIQHGRNVSVHQTMVESVAGGIELRSNFIPATFSIVSDTPESNCGSTYEIDGNLLILNCNDTGTVTISYEYLQEQFARFDLPVAKPATLRVYLDGVETQAFEHVGNQLIITSYPGPTRLVRVIIEPQKAK